MDNENVNKKKRSASDISLSAEENKFEFDEEPPNKRQKITGPKPKAMESQILMHNQDVRSSMIFYGLAIRHLQFTTKNTFMPSANRMFKVLHTMNVECMMDKCYTAIFFFYTCIDLRIYYAIVFYLRIMLVEQKMGVLTVDHSNVLNLYQISIDLQTLPIAGPLVPYFTALCAAKTGDAGFGHVFPILSAFSMLTANVHSFENTAQRSRFPNLVGLSAAVANVRHSKERPYYWNLEDPSAMAQARAGPAGANGNNANQAISPGLHYYLPMSMQQRRVYSRGTQQWKQSQFQLNYESNHSTYYSIMTNNDNIDFFQRLVKLAKWNANYFDQSKTLGDLPLIDSKANLFQFTTEDKFVNLVHTRFHAADLRSGRVSAASKELVMSDLEAEMAMNSQIYINFPANYNGTKMDPCPVNGQYWSILYQRLSIGLYDSRQKLFDMIRSMKLIIRN